MSKKKISPSVERQENTPLMPPVHHITYPDIQFKHKARVMHTLLFVFGLEALLYNLSVTANH